MKALILASALAVASLPAQAGTKEAGDAIRCMTRGVSEAFNGNFSNWVLPNFVPGNHLRAGQYIVPDGAGGCVVGGAPNRPLS